MTAAVHSVEVTRHDVSLVGIGAVLLAGLAVGLLSTVTLSLSLFAASVPAAGCMLYALFYKPPKNGQSS